MAKDFKAFKMRLKICIYYRWEFMLLSIGRNMSSKGVNIGDFTEKMKNATYSKCPRNSIPFFNTSYIDMLVI